MIVRVKLHAILRKFLPAGSEDNTAVVDVPDGATVADVIAKLGIPEKHAGMLVCGDDYLERDTRLADGQEFSIFPPLAGGVGQALDNSTTDESNLDVSAPSYRGPDPTVA